jgi:thiazole/oxazole-forming peptide maturase SagD family component
VTVNDLFCQVTPGAICGSISYGFFAGTFNHLYRWRLTGRYEERAQWAEMLRRGVLLADLLLWAGQHESSLRTVVEHGLDSGWLVGTPVGEPMTESSLESAEVVLLGSRTGSWQERQLALIGPWDRTGVAIPPAGPVASSAWLDAYLRQGSVKAVVWDAVGVQWDGMAAICALAGRIPLLVCAQLGRETIVVTLPRDCGCCLECVWRWHVGSSRWPLERAAWYRLSISGNQQDIFDAPGLTRLIDKRLDDLLERRLTSPLTEILDSESDEALQLRPFRHPSCSQRTSDHRAPRSCGSYRSRRAQPQLDHLLAELTQDIPIVHNFTLEDVGSREESYFVARAAINSAFRSGVTDALFCSGDGEDRRLAISRCLMECVERYCSFHFACESLLRDSQAALSASSRVLDPRALPLFAEHQYEQPDFPYQRFDENQAYDWVQTVSLTTGDPVFVPADAVYAGYRSPGRALMAASSTGTAAHPSWEEAVKAALLEVIERDALALIFLLRLGRPHVDIGEDEILLKRVLAMEADGYELRFLSLRLDINVHGVLALAARPAGPPPFLLKGAAAALDGRLALQHAFREMWRSYLYYQRYPQHLPTSRQGINRRSVEYNIAYYQTPEAADRLSFLLDTDDDSRVAIDDEPDGSHTAVVKRLEDDGYEALCVDCTLPEVARLGIHCVKVVVPGLQPLSFGTSPWHLGGDRIASVADRLGRDRAAVVDRLNLQPHFFS